MRESRRPATPRGHRGGGSHARPNAIAERRTAAPEPGPFGWDSGALRRIPKPRSIRAKVVCLLVVPVLSLMTLWGLAAAQTGQTVYTLMQLQQLNAAMHAPTDDIISALQRERIAVAQQLAVQDGEGQVPPALSAQYARTDNAAAELRDGAAASAAAATGLGVDVSGRISALLSDVAGLPALRGEAARRQVSGPAAQASYTKAIGDAIGLEDAVAAALDRVGPGDTASEASAVVELTRGREMLARQAAIVTGSQDSALTTDAYREFAGAVYSETELEQAALPRLRPLDAASYRAVLSSSAFRRLTGAEQSILAAGPGASQDAVAGPEQSVAALAPIELDRLGGVVSAAGTAAIASVDPYGHALATKAGVGAVAGLVAVALSLLVSVWIGRVLVLELTGLRDAALDLAGRRLPRAISRLRAGEPVDLDAEIDAARAGSIGGLRDADASDAVPDHDELGQVGEAMALVHRAALRAAVERAQAISGVGGVFLNLARRSQVLLHRQLALLDQMERRIDEPADLEDLFRLDHLATRMRRHAEGLLILSGAAPGRGWRRPMPLTDVARAAVAEIEDYARVDVRQMPDVYIVGAAVADLAHLLAELVENATSFSPPHTRVHVHGARVAAGYAVQIEDRGLGMGIEALTEANRRIDSARQDDLLGSDQLGLYVVSRLARRHGVRVALRQSAYGGAIAVVLLPKSLLTDGEQPAFPPAPPAPLRITPHQRRPPGDGERASRQRRSPALVSVPAGATAPTAADAPAQAEAFADSRSAAAPAVASTPAHAPAAAPTASVPLLPEFDQPSMIFTESTGAELDDGLPQRVRQASLAPGLRAASDASGSPHGRGSRRRAAADAEADPASRSPEQARATMSAYQRGWQLGRGGVEFGGAQRAGAPEEPDG